MSIFRGLISYGVRAVGGAVRPLSLTASDELIVSVGGGSGAVDANVTQIASQNVASTGVNGTMPVEGPTAEGSADLTSYPVQVAARVVQVLSALTNNDIQKLLVDLYGRLYVRDASYDSFSGGNRVETLNDPSTNHSYNSITWGDETDGAVSKNYYPSSAGTDIGDRSVISAIVSARDGTWGFEVANDDDWVDVTASLRDEATDRTGYGAAHFTEPDSATVDWAVSYHNQCKFKKFRFHFTPADATSVFEVQGFGRAM